MKNSLEEYNTEFKNTMWKFSISNINPTVKEIYIEGLSPSIKDRVLEITRMTSQQHFTTVEEYMNNVLVVYGEKKFNDKKVCDFCNKPGHFKKDCFKNPKSASYKPLKDIVCNRCKEKGHYANQCPTLPNNNNKQSSNVNTKLLDVSLEEFTSTNEIVTPCLVNGNEVNAVVDT